MSERAITARLRVAAELLRQRGVVTKGVDMSAPAVTARLRTVSALTDLCLRLQAAGQRPSSSTARPVER